MMMMMMMMINRRFFLGGLLSLAMLPAFGTFTFEDAVQNDGSGTSATCTFGAAPAENELVLAYFNVNGPPSSWTGPTGAGYTEALLESNVQIETMQHGLYYKIAGASESATITVSLGDSQQWQALCMAFSANDSIVLELAAQGGWDATDTDDMIIEAFDGRAYNSGELHVVYGGKDNANLSGATYDTDSSTSFIVPTGAEGTNNNRASAHAYRIFATSGTWAGNVQIDEDAVGGVSDPTYSMHIAFSEDTGSASIIPLIMHHRQQQTQD